MENQLTPKQQRFCDEYLIDLNATQAARRAGYTESTADGGHLMNNPLIQAYLSDKQKKKNDELDVSHDRIMQELAKIAFSDAGNYFDNDGNLKPWEQIAQKDRAAVVVVDVKRVYSEDGKKLTRENIKLRLHSKLRALDMLLYRLDVAEMQEAEAEENKPYDTSYLDDNFGLPKVDMSGFEPGADVMREFDDEEVPEPVVNTFKPIIPMREAEVLQPVPVDEVKTQGQQFYDPRFERPKSTVLRWGNSPAETLPPSASVGLHTPNRPRTTAELRRDRERNGFGWRNRRSPL